MKRLTLCALFLTFLAQILPSHAASNSSRSSSFSGSKGFAVRSAPPRSLPPTASGEKPTAQYRNFRSLNTGTTGSSVRSTEKATSVLNRSNKQPSPELQTIIREKESSGPGWLGTALLVSLLSRHDMSDSDREWINDRIAEAKKNGEENPAAPLTLSDIVFSWSLPPTFYHGQPSEISVSASVGKEQVTPECQLKNTKSISDGTRAVLTWTPVEEVSAVVTCSAKGLNDQRLIIVSEAEPQGK